MRVSAPVIESGALTPILYVGVPMDGNWTLEPGTVVSDSCGVGEEIIASTEEGEPPVLTIASVDGGIEVTIPDEGTEICTFDGTVYQCDAYTDVADFSELGFDAVIDIDGARWVTFSSATTGINGYDIPTSCALSIEWPLSHIEDAG